MTVEEFKKENPKLSHLHGEELWNAMEHSRIRQQKADEIIKQIKPIWKTHTLRWLFYRKKKNLVFGENNYTANTMCSLCKKGTDGPCFYIMGLNKLYCPHCGTDELKRISNTNFNHRLYIIGKFISNYTWKFLSMIRLVRSSIEGRYDMFGDERRHVESWQLNYSTGRTSYRLKKRKWWEYILIEKPRHNF